MIPRILVPVDARPPAGADAPTKRRRPTTMDERTLVPAMLPIVHLNGQSTIPTNLPLESIAARVVVPRDVSREAYNVQENHATPVQPTEMDERVAVPLGAAPPETIEPLLNVPSDLVNPDVFMTGEVQLVAREHPTDKSEIITRSSSIVFHILMIAAILILPKVFPPHVPTQEEIELGQRQITVLLPPGALDALKPSTRPPQPVPKVHVDPRVLREVAPPAVPAPPPERERPVKELPSAPTPKLNAVQPEPQATTPVPKVEVPKPVVKLEAPDSPPTQRGPILPKSTSPSRSIQDALRGSRPSGPSPIGGGGQLPGGSARGGGGTAYGGIEMLTPDEGVDFNSYLQRVYVTVKRNWFSVMPASVELGEKGIVYLTFRIYRDGNVPSDEPVIERNSGKEALDRAAYSSVRASNPFEPLPAQFKGPYIELRYRYYYNLMPAEFN